MNGRGDGAGARHAPVSDVRIDVGGAGDQRKKVVVIGAGFAGLSAACYLAKEGFAVTVIDRLPEVGGRCRQWEKDGYVFDMGPSWYWMPDVFDNFFAAFGRKTSDFLTLRRLDPPYRLFLADGRPLDIPDKVPEVEALFEKLQLGGRAKFREFMAQAKYKYQVSMADYVQRPSLHLLEFFDIRMLREAFRLHMFQSQAAHVRSFFTHPDLITIMEWPVLFLGGAPKQIPAMYSMMNYAAIELGTWYPMGGMFEVPLAMKKVALSLGVEFKLGEEHAATKIAVDASGHATAVETKSGAIGADFVVGAADYHHIEMELLDGASRNMTEQQWDSFVLSPSALLFFLGVSRRLSNLRHHNLFFDEDIDKHASEIYDKPRWPSRPLFYACLQSLSDPSCAPQGHENLFILIPLAPGLQDSDEMRERYYEIVIERLERHTGQPIRDAVTVKRAYAMKDFEDDYKSYKGNAYGLANTLSQTAVFKPPAKSRRVDNLYFAGQLTVPGPGVPPALISGKIVANLIAEHRAKGKGRTVGTMQLLQFVPPERVMTFMCFFLFVLTFFIVFVFRA